MKWLKRGGIVAAGVAVALVLSTCGGAEELFQTVEERVTEADSVETYSVIYDGNGNDGGAAPVDENAYVEGATVTVSGPGSLAKTGETFVGWNTQEAGGGTVYQGGNTFVMQANDVTLYAQWSENAYRLTLTAGVGGEISNPGTSTVNVDHGVPTSITATPDDGYTFDGWTVDIGVASIADATLASTSVTLEDGDATVSASFVDSTAPAAPDVSGGTASPTNDTTPTWSWSSGGGGNGTFQFKLDSDDFSSGATTTSDTTYTVATEDALLDSDGDHTLYVREQDDAGNWSDPGYRTITLDTVAPHAPTNVSSSSFPIDSTPTWTWSSGGNGGSGTYRCKIDDSDLETDATVVTGTSFTVASESALAEGEYTLFVQERDAVGNWSTSSTDTITVSISAPSVLVAPADGGVSDGVTPTLEWELVSGAGAYRVQVSDDGFSSSPLLDETTTASGLNVAVVLEHLGSYEWRVKTRNADGIWGAQWSTVWAFTAEYTIGDDGPAGGVIFFDDEDDGSDNYIGVRFLEAAPEDYEVKVEWGGRGTDVQGDNSGFYPELPGLMQGKLNTSYTVSALGDNGSVPYAAQVCDGYTLGGYEWYLPAKDTLDLMYHRRNTIGGFAEWYYWSSTEEDAEAAWFQDFHDGRQSTNWKNAAQYVRPVRRF